MHVAVWNTGTTNKGLASSVSDSTSCLISTTSKQILSQFSLVNSENRRQIWRLSHWLKQRFHDVLTRTNCGIFSAHSNSAVCFEVLFTSTVQGISRDLRGGHLNTLGQNGRFRYEKWITLPPIKQCSSGPRPRPSSVCNNTSKEHGSENLKSRAHESNLFTTTGFLVNYVYVLLCTYLNGDGYSKEYLSGFSDSVRYWCLDRFSFHGMNDLQYRCVGFSGRTSITLLP